MIPQSMNRVAESSPVAASGSFGVSRDDEAHILTMLRDTLYSDKVLAVLREYGANAWDANVEAGRGDVPIRVTLPTSESLTLEIRDSGLGISREDMLGRFLMAGSSTKRNSDKTVGTLGIGRLAGFAYSDNFVVESRHAGVRSTYVALIDPSERGELRLLDEALCDDSGLTIKIAVKPGDVALFCERARRLFAHYSPRPEINVALPEPLPRVGSGALSRDFGWVAVMGCVPYRVDLSQIEAPECAQHLGGELHFGIGELHFASSREDLRYSDQTKLALKLKLEAFLAEYVAKSLAEIESAATSPWDKRLRMQSLRKFGLKLDFGAMDIALPESFSTFVAWLRDGRKRSKAKKIDVDSRTRLVLRDDRRALVGFDFKSRDCVVLPNKGIAAEAAEKELRDWIALAGIAGIPVARTSSLPWTRPDYGPRTPRDPAASHAAKIKAFELVGDHHRRPYSNCWKPVEREAAASDVFVILDAFCELGNHRFFDQVAADRAMLAAFGEVVPPIYGYRMRKGKPPPKPVGRPFAEWRAALPKRLLAQPATRALVEQWRFCDVGSAPTAAQLAAIEAALGDHPVAQLCRDVRAASETPWPTKKGVRLLVDRAGLSADCDLSALKPWPLLVAEGIEKLWSESAVAWLGYVKATTKKRRAK